eukprot:scaffold147107_cov53-Attheya_sp.AAC.1
MSDYNRRSVLTPNPRDTGMSGTSSHRRRDRSSRSSSRQRSSEKSSSSRNIRNEPKKGIFHDTPSPAPSSTRGTSFSAAAAESSSPYRNSPGQQQYHQQYQQHQQQQQQQQPRNNNENRRINRRPSFDTASSASTGPATRGNYQNTPPRDNNSMGSPILRANYPNTPPHDNNSMDSPMRMLPPRSSGGRPSPNEPSPSFPSEMIMRAPSHDLSSHADSSAPFFRAFTEDDQSSDKDDEEMQIVELTTLGNDYFAKGEYDSAMHMYAQVLQWSSQKVPSNDPRKRETSKQRSRNVTARILINIGAVHIQRGDTEEAKSVLKTALKISKSISKQVEKMASASASSANASQHDNNMDELFSSMNLSSTASMGSGSASRATYSSNTSRHKELNEIRLKSDAVTADVLQNLALLHLKTEDFEKALDTYTQCLSLRKRCFRHWAKSAGITGSFDSESAPKSQQTLQTLNHGRLELADVLNNIGQIHLKLGRLEDSIKPLTGALELRRAALPDPNHFLITSLLESLGLVYSELGGDKYQDAYECFEEVVFVKKTMLNPDHLEIAEALNGMAGALYKLGQPDESLSLSQEAETICRTNIVRDEGEHVIGGDQFHNLAVVSLSTALENQSRVLIQKEMYQEAKRGYQEALHYRFKVLGERHASVATCLSKVASICFTIREYDEARKAYRELARVRELVVGRHHVSVAEAMNNVGFCFGELGDYFQARFYHTEALKIFKMALGTERHQSVAETFNYLGMTVKREGGKRYEAVDYFTNALRIYRDCGVDPQDPHVLSVIRNMTNSKQSSASSSSSMNEMALVLR